MRTDRQKAGRIDTHFYFIVMVMQYLMTVFDDFINLHYFIRTHKVLTPTPVTTWIGTRGLPGLL